MTGVLPPVGKNRALRFAMLVSTALATPSLFQQAIAAEVVSPLVQIAQAEDKRQFDIAAQALTDALPLFGRQAGIQISAKGDEIRDLQTAGVSGTLSIEAGLRNLLSGTGLIYRIGDDGTVTVGLPEQSSNSDEIILAPIYVEAESDDTLIQDGYVPVISPIGTKKDTPLVEVSQSISVVTERQMDDRSPRTVNEALGYTPGINSQSYGFDPRFDSFTIRGFDGVYNGVFRDGLRQFNGSTALYRTDPYGLEGIEILKGPSSTLYGASSSGGFINQVTKRPTKKPLYEIEGIVGSYDRYQGNFDFSDSITEDETLKYRLTGVVRDSDTELKGFKDDRTYIAPSLAWRPTEDTKFTVLTEYMDSLTGGTAAYYNDANGLTDIYGGDGRYNDFEHEQYRLGYEFEHRFNDTFTFRQNARYSNVAIDLEYAYVTAVSPVTRAAGRAVEEQSTFVIDNHLVTSVATGALDHTITSGFDYGTTKYNETQGFGAIPTNGGTLALDPTTRVDQEQTQMGVYIHDQASWDKWRFTLGGRYDWLDAETKRSSGESDQDTGEFSWQTGISYVTDFGLVPYANVTTSFTPNVGVLLDGTPAKPTIGDQVELGAKYEFLDQNAVITASVFDIKQTDGVVFDASSGVNKQVQQDMRSRGFEIEAVASLDNGLSFNAGYTYTDVEIEDGAVGTNGKQVSGTPEHTASAYVDYTFQNGSLKGFGLGSGIRFFGESFGNDTNTIDNEERYFVDGAVHYDLGELSSDLEGTLVKVNATNIFNQTRSNCKAAYCYQDEGRMVFGSVRYRF